MHENNSEMRKVRCMSSKISLFKLAWQVVLYGKINGKKKDKKIKDMESELDLFKNKIGQIEQKLDKIVKGEIEQLHSFDFSTVFSNNFLFGAKEARLV